jgi:methylenetetrahydrofolate dehydrogenase (NADP+)/methenyltetrahydrofolate cyclohydrolase
MPAARIDGEQLAAAMRDEIALNVAARLSAGRTPPGLAAVLVGDNPASQVYVRNKRRDCEKVGFNSWLHALPADAGQSELLDLVARLNADPDVHGILVQLPLPRQMDEEAVIRSIDPRKDVDGFHPENVGLLAAGHPRY